MDLSRHNERLRSFLGSILYQNSGLDYVPLPPPRMKKMQQRINSGLRDIGICGEVVIFTEFSLDD